MPTGYTAGILDGTIKTFPEFAKTCMRAFGATVHMKDEPSDKEYTPREPSNYHIEEIKRINKTLHKLRLSNERLEAERKKKLLEDLTYHKKAIVKWKEDKERLNNFLKEATTWIPPTKDHQGLKDFMIEQITKTLDFDNTYSYHSDATERINNEMKNLNGVDIRKEITTEAKKDIAYHTKEHRAEIRRCNESNKWVEDLVKSLNENQNGNTTKTE